MKKFPQIQEIVRQISFDSDNNSKGKCYLTQFKHVGNYTPLWRYETDLLSPDFAHIQILLSPRNSFGGDIVPLPLMGGWVSDWVYAWVRPALACGHDSNHSCCPITFKLHV